MNTLSSVIVGIYLLLVAVRGNSKEFISLTVRDKSFLKWGVAILILIWLKSFSFLRGNVSVLIGMAFIGLFISNGAKISAGFKNFWDYLGE